MVLNLKEEQELFGISDKELISMYTEMIEENEKELSIVLRKKHKRQKESAMCDKNNEFLYDIMLEELGIEIKRLKGRMFIYGNRVNIIKGVKGTYKSFDIDLIKKIPITDYLQNDGKIYQSSHKAFYKAPWREEKSASLVVYTDSNTWFDFGEHKGGDIIALIMRLHECDFVTACKFLSS